MPSRLSCQLENDGIFLKFLKFCFNSSRILFKIKEAQIIDDDEMKKFKEEYLTDVDYIIAK